MPTQRVNGSTMHYLDQGRGSPLVLLHGFPLDGRMWAGQVEPLAATHRVIVPDFRGFGQSPPAGGFTMESLADDVHELMAQLHAVPFVLAGLSMGGYVALAYARKYAPDLRALVLLDTKAEPDTPDGKAGREKMIQLAQEKGSAAVGDAMLPRLLPADVIKNRPQIVKKLREMTDQTSPITIQHALAAMRDRPDQTEMLASIAVPTLVITGDADVITPPEVCEAMQRKIPNSQLAIIKGAGHMTTMEQPEQVNRAMLTFLSRG